MVWREQAKHVTDCYIWAVDVTGINRRNRGSLKYPDLQSPRRSVDHWDEIPVLIFGELPDISDEDAFSVEGHEDKEEVVLPKRSWMIKFANSSLSTDSVELLASRLKEKTPPLWQCSHHVLPLQASRVHLFFSIQWKTWCTMQVLHSFCSSLECHCTNPKIGDVSSTAASDYWNVFCYTMANSLPLYPSLTRLHWRGSMKRWSMCWRKWVMISISGLFVLTWSWWTFCRDNNLDLQSSHVFCACGIVGTVLSITRRRTGLCRRDWCLARETTLWWTKSEYSSNRCISSSA